jgi:hypothetical protein
MYRRGKLLVRELTKSEIDPADTAAITFHPVLFPPVFRRREFAAWVRKVLRHHTARRAQPAQQTWV